MHTININVSETREVTIDFKTAGNIAENNETLLSFEIPKEYSSYYKYLDILKEKDKKTQTVVSTDDENKFSYKLPYELTDGRCLYLQLVLKKGENVFKSNIFSIMFNGAICGGQHLVGDYQDAIQFIMENKSDKKDVENLNKDVYRKLDSNIFYSQLEVQEAVNNKKVDIEAYDYLTNDFRTKYLDLLSEINKEKIRINQLISTKVDKEEGKGLSENDFTNGHKKQISKNQADIEHLAVSINTLNNELLDEIKRTDNLENLIEEDVYTKEEIDVMIGDIDEALDELHNYAQAIINGGAE